jgi:type I restriction enzyme S subunit
MREYSSYKPTGIEWIGKIPENWEFLKVKNLFWFKKGIGISKSDIIEEGKFNCLLYGELFTRFKDLNVIPNDFSKTNQENNIISEGNELVIPGSTTTTSVDLCNCKTLNFSGVQLGGDIIILKPLKSDLKNEYYSYFISNVSKPDFEMSGRGVTIHHIYPKQIREINVPYPPLQEQEQIVKFLDEKTSIIDKLISTKERKIELLKEKRISLINVVITKGLNPNVKLKDSDVEWIGDIPEHWVVSKLGFYSTKIGSGSTPRGGSEIYEDSGVPFIRSQNVHFNGLRLYNVSFINIETHNSMNGSKVVKNDVLLNITGGSIGRCCVVEDEIEMNVNQHVSIIRTTNSLLNYYLNYTLSSDIGQSQVIFNLTGGNREGLTIEGIRNFRITIPPILEQKEIIEYLNEITKEIDDLVSMEQKKIELLKEYRQSLISEVITGKIKVVE